jgi:hypothetical protein
MDLAGALMPSKIKIKLGLFELDYEVDEAISKDALIEIVEKISTLLPKEALKAQKGNDKGKEDEDSGEAHSTSTIAQKLKADSGSGLAKAAMARLVIYGKQSTVKRKELLTEMQSAKTYYNKTYSSNLTTYLKTLVSEGTVLESGTDTYALSESAISAIKLALNGQS